VIRYIKTIEEGAVNDLFVPTVPPNPIPTAIETAEVEINAVANTIVPHITGELAKDSNVIRAAGANIDDDNEPAEENISQPTVDVESPFENEWGFKGLCYRRKDGHSTRNASCSMHREPWYIMSPGDWLLLFFPMSYIIETVIPIINSALEKDMPKIMLWEYVRCLGL